ncbi:MAG: (d)CMP kinase [Marinifilaceae bacterium]
MEKRKLVIAVDGHSSSGKSTLAKDFAKELEYAFIDTGAMYRTVSLAASRAGVFGENNELNLPLLKEIVENIDIKFTYNRELKKSQTYLDGELVEDEIRSLEVSNKVSYVAAVSFVRSRLVDLQRSMGEEAGVIMDGRDIGTVVFPNADIKLFVTADVAIRAERRYKELKLKGEDVSLQDIIDNVKQRDYIDENRDESPLKKADDAILLDTGKMTRESQLDWLMKIVEEKLEK